MIVPKTRAMSTFLHSKHSGRIRSVEDLKLYFQNYSKPASQKFVGIECELLPVRPNTGEALPYRGEDGVEAVLNFLAYEFGYEKVIENGHTIALRKGSSMIGLEPGSQVEFSSEPLQNIHQVKERLDQFFFELKTAARFLGGMTFLAYGIQPFSDKRSIEWVPKERYTIMSQYLGKRGQLAHEMMKRTASIQVSFDYTSEGDAFEKMCLVMRLTPIAYALFANSSFSKGRPSGYVSERLRIWQETDPERSGLLVGALCPHASFERYLDHLLDLRMMFLVREGKWVRLPRLTFRKFVESGFQNFHPTLEDFELHLSTLFTEARFKHYLEVRSADGQRPHLIPAVAAFWKGILYDDSARKNAAALIKGFSEKDILKLYQDVSKKGLKARARGASILELAKELVRLSEKGLESQHEFNEREENEAIYLIPLKEEVLKTGETQGERLVRLWHTSFRKDPKNLIDYLKVV